MLSRIINPAIRALRINNKAVLLTPVRFASGDYPPMVTMDDLPVPCGDFNTLYKAHDAKSNQLLGASVIFLIASLFALKASGLVHLNYSPPDRPVDKNTYY